MHGVGKLLTALAAALAAALFVGPPTVQPLAAGLLGVVVGGAITWLHQVQEMRQQRWYRVVEAYVSWQNDIVAWQADYQAFFQNAEIRREASADSARLRAVLTVDALKIFDEDDATVKAAFELNDAILEFLTSDESPKPRFAKLHRRIFDDLETVRTMLKRRDPSHK